MSIPYKSERAVWRRAISIQRNFPLCCLMLLHFLHLFSPSHAFMCRTRLLLKNDVLNQNLGFCSLAEECYLSSTLCAHITPDVSCPTVPSITNRNLCKWWRNLPDCTTEFHWLVNDIMYISIYTMTPVKSRALVEHWLRPFTNTL